METVYFSLADKVFRLDTPIEIEITHDLQDFIINKFQNEDDWITFEHVDEIPEISGEFLRFQRRCFLKTSEGDVVCCDSGAGTKPFAMIAYGRDWRVRVYHQPNAQEISYRSHAIMNLLGLEQLLLRHDALILHASFVRYQGRGILFSAPPGTGKSTQAELWAEYMGAEVLNGDRTGIRKVDGTWRAYGLPYAGSSRIYRNDSAPIEAIVLLRQGAENRIRPVGAAEAMRFLLPEFSVHRWDSDFVNKVLDISSALLREVPVYLLECTPDRRSVDLLRKTIMSEK